LGDLAERHGGTVDDGAGALVIRRVAPIGQGESADLCPLTDRRHLSAALASPCALLVTAELAPLVPPGRRWVHAHATFALAALLADGDRPRERAKSHLASIDPRAELAPDVGVGPFAVVMEGSPLDLVRWWKRTPSFIRACASVRESSSARRRW